MKMNKITRGANRAVYDETKVYDILDSGFLCHVGYVLEGKPLIIPTTFGRDGNTIYLHGSSKNGMLHAALAQDEICISVTLLDGLVLAKSLFDSSANYRSVVIFGKAQAIEDQELKWKALNCICQHIIPGRNQEVVMGTANQIEKTMVIAVEIQSASAKIREGGPMGDEDLVSPFWSGHIPLSIKVEQPIFDVKREVQVPLSASVENFVKSDE